MRDILNQVRRAHERAELRSERIAAQKETPDRLVKWIGEVLLQSLKHEGGIVGGTRKTVNRFGNIDPVEAGVRSQISPITRPGVIVGPGAEMRLDRIEMDVARAVEEVVAVLHHNCLIACLPEMPMAMMPSIEPLGVPYKQPLHVAAESSQGCLQKQVKVVSHEDKGKDDELLDGDKFLQKVKKRPAIQIVRKSGCTIHAVRQEVVGSAGKLHSDRSRHGSTFAHT